jgi:tRNA (cytidine/uridine-2'-O-)-methyltransferase
MRIALFQPDIPGNVGAILRLSACLCVPVDIIDPCGFPFSDRRMKRSGMDYAAHVSLTRHPDWNAFRTARAGQRIILLSSHAESRLHDVSFQPDDILLFGSESAGVPDHVRAESALALRIPMAAGLRSLNLAVSAGIAVSEALRQTKGFPA